MWLGPGAAQHAVINQFGSVPGIEEEAMAAVAPSSLLPQLLADTAVQDPDRVVIHDLSLGERITAAGLHHQAMQWAGTLRSAGVGPGDTVLSMLPSGATPIAVWTGVAWLLAITVTVNEEYRGRLLADVLADSRARVMVVHGEYLDQVLEVLGEIGVERLIVVDDPRSAPRDTESVGGVVIEPVAAFLGEPAAEGELTAPRAHDISAIVYTSGTTGPSKGVMISWQQMHATAVWCLPFGELGPGDRAYLPYPAYHMSSPRSSAWSCAAVGWFCGAGSRPRRSGRTCATTVAPTDRWSGAWRPC